MHDINLPLWLYMIMCFFVGSGLAYWVDIIARLVKARKS